jgi:hypothetical protein
VTVLTADITPFSAETFLELGSSFYQFGFGMISPFFGFWGWVFISWVCRLKDGRCCLGCHTLRGQNNEA